MQKRFEPIFSSDDRAAIMTSFLTTIGYCGAIVVVCVTLSFVGGRVKDDSSLASGGATAEVRASMPL